MRYLICWIVTDVPDDDTAIARPDACEDAAEVGRALRVGLGREAEEGEADWAVFELVGGRFERRSVTFAPDGKTVVSVQ